VGLDPGVFDRHRHDVVEEVVSIIGEDGLHILGVAIDRGKHPLPVQLFDVVRVPGRAVLGGVDGAVPAGLLQDGLEALLLPCQVVHPMPRGAGGRLKYPREVVVVPVHLVIAMLFGAVFRHTWLMRRM